MGGSGGRYFSGDVDKILNQLQRAQNSLDSESYEAEINSYLADLLSEFNDRPVDAISDYLEQIGEVVEDGMLGTIDLRFGGSVSKHTYVDGLSDVDSLVVLNDAELADQGPEAAKSYLAERVSERFPGADVVTGDLAVTVHFDDISIQLLPALRQGNNLRISNATGSAWTDIDPRGFTEKLTACNQENGGKVVPVVKLAKAIISGLPEPQRMSGYHTEAMAVEVFEGYKGPRTPKAMLQHFFSAAAERVLDPIRDSTGQSIHVDDSLGKSASVERRIVSSGLSRTARRMRLADTSQRLDDWRSIFGEI